MDNLDLQPEDMAGVSTHPSEDTISSSQEIEKKDEDKISKHFFTYEDLRKYLMDRLDINILPTNAFYEYKSPTTHSVEKLEFYTGDLVRFYIQPSRGIGHWEDGIVIQGDGGFYIKSYSIKFNGLLSFRGGQRSLRSVGKSNTDFYLKYSNIKGNKL